MTSAGALKILFLAHDLSDMGVQRLADMMHRGGASVTLAGFRRTAEPFDRIAGCPVINFGLTYNADFKHRIASVMRELALLGRYRHLFEDADIILARNLEMLVLATRGRGMKNPPPVIVYKCIDIHRLLLRQDAVGAGLRWLEKRLARNVSALITSSPVFEEKYFKILNVPVKVLENKVPDMDSALAQVKPPPRAPGPPWIIGWYGIIRCKKSLQTLIDLVQQSQGKVEVVIRGRPAKDVFGDFAANIASVPGIRFLGAYKNPDDLAAMYHNAHFTWAIDMFDEGLNSSWLLPNRVYEGGLFGAVPLALADVETGHFIERLGIGATFKKPLAASLGDFFAQLTPEKYQAMEEAVAAIPRSTWAYDLGNCKQLVDYLRSLTGKAHG